MTAGHRVVGSLFSGTEDAQVQAWIQLHSVWPWRLGVDAPPEAVGAEKRTAAARSDPIESVIERIPIVGTWLMRGPISHVWLHLADPFIQVFHLDLTTVRLAYLLLLCLWSTVVWALFGGALTRVAAVWLVRGETLGPLAALRYATQRWLPYFFAPLLPLGGVLLIGIPLVVLGFCMRLQVAVPLAGMVWPLVLLAGLLLAILVVGLLVAWPLLWPGVSVEESDAFDAVSRGYAYAFQRPLHYLFYLLVASVLGMATMLVVDVFAGSVLDLSTLFVGWGSGVERIGQIIVPGSQVEPSVLLASGAWLIGLWSDCVFTLQLAFQFGFFWSAATAVYLLLRRDVDATEMDEISVEEDEPASELSPLAETGSQTGPDPSPGPANA